MKTVATEDCWFKMWQNVQDVLRLDVSGAFCWSAVFMVRHHITAVEIIGRGILHWCIMKQNRQESNLKRRKENQLDYSVLLDTMVFQQQAPRWPVYRHGLFFLLYLTASRGCVLHSHWKTKMALLTWARHKDIEKTLQIFSAPVPGQHFSPS